MMKRQLRMCTCGVGLFLLTWSLAGCGAARPQPADPEVARPALRTALDAWKDGQTPQSLQARQPPIHVADREWAGGARLVSYEIAPKDELFGSDLRCQVRLTLRDRKGKERSKKATYSVGTRETLTVVREDDE